MSCTVLLIASATMFVRLGDGGTDATEGVDMGEDCAVYDAKDVRRRFTSEAESWEEDGELVRRS